jgi:hypothetical protein
VKKLFSIFYLFVIVAFGETVIFPQVSPTEPELDGKFDSAWYEVPSYEFKRIGFSAPLKMRSLIYGDSIYFLIEWKDASHNKKHKPWSWDGKKGAYVVGPEREDLLTLRWGINMDNERINSSNDVWMWGSVRANQGFADDLYEIVSKKPLQKSVKKRDFEGQAYFLQSQGDVGRKCWVTNFENTAFWLTSRYNSIRPSGSRSDVQAMALWKNKTWTIEIKRKLSTSNYDDVEFNWGQIYYFDISKDLFENAHVVHNISLFDDDYDAPFKSPIVLEMPGKPQKPSLLKSLNEKN